MISLVRMRCAFGGPLVTASRICGVCVGLFARCGCHLPTRRLSKLSTLCVCHSLDYTLFMENEAPDFVFYRFVFYRVNQTIFGLLFLFFCHPPLQRQRVVSVTRYSRPQHRGPNPEALLLEVESDATKLLSLAYHYTAYTISVCAKWFCRVYLMSVVFLD